MTGRQRLGIPTPDWCIWSDTPRRRPLAGFGWLTGHRLGLRHLHGGEHRAAPGIQLLRRITAIETCVDSASTARTNGVGSSPDQDFGDIITKCGRRSRHAIRESRR